MPQDMNVRLSTAMAALLWPIGIALALADVFVDLDVGEVGVLAGVAAGVIQIRGFFYMQAQREHNAFILGQDSARFRVPHGD